MQTQASAEPAPARMAEQPTRPQQLTIRFTNSSDTPKVYDFFNSERKRQMDPQGKIRKRDKDELSASIDSGSAVIAFDEKGDLRFFGMASEHFSYGDTQPEGIIELGAIMSDVRGYGVAQLGSAMLALRESTRLRTEYPCLAESDVHALVARDNAAAQKVFTRDLDWAGISSEIDAKRLYDTQRKYSNALDR